MMAVRESVLSRLVHAFQGKAAPPRRRRGRQVSPTFDAMEDRLVLSHFGHYHHLALQFASSSFKASTNSLSSTTATTSSTTGATSSTTATTRSTNEDPDSTTDCAGGAFQQNTQLQTDIQQLRTDIGTVYSNSSVTDSQRQALATDFQALHTAGVTVDISQLQTVATELLTALANGTYLDNASTIQSDFIAAFSGASGAALTTDQAALVDTAYNDFLAVAQNLNITPDELSAITTDLSNIQNDLNNGGSSSGTSSQPSYPFSTLNLILGGPMVHGGFSDGFGGGHGRFGGHVRRF